MKRAYIFCLVVAVAVGTLATLDPFTDRYLDEVGKMSYHERLSAEDLRMRVKTGEITEEEYDATLRDLVAANNQRRLALASRYGTTARLVTLPTKE